MGEAAAAAAATEDEGGGGEEEEEEELLEEAEATCITFETERVTLFLSIFSQTHKEALLNTFPTLCAECVLAPFSPRPDCCRRRYCGKKCRIKEEGEIVSLSGAASAAGGALPFLLLSLCAKDRPLSRRRPREKRSTANGAAADRSEGRRERRRP